MATNLDGWNRVSCVWTSTYCELAGSWFPTKSRRRRRRGDSKPTNRVPNKLVRKHGGACGGEVDAREELSWQSKRRRATSSWRRHAAIPPRCQGVGRGRTHFNITHKELAVGTADTLRGRLAGI